MINVAIFNLKDIINFIFKLLIPIIILYCLVYAYKLVPVTVYLEQILSITRYTNEENDTLLKQQFDSIGNRSWLESVLNKELSMKTCFIVEEKNELEQAIVENDEIYNENNFVQADADIQVIEENNLKTKYTNQFESVEINNSSKYELTEEILTPNIMLTNTKNVIIFHTHTTESYTQSNRFQYIATGSYRTTDLNYSVSRVGDELENQLKARRI